MGREVSARKIRIREVDAPQFYGQRQWDYDTILKRATGLKVGKALELDLSKGGVHPARASFRRVVIERGLARKLHVTGSDTLKKLWIVRVEDKEA